MAPHRRQRTATAVAVGAVAMAIAAAGCGGARGRARGTAPPGSEHAVTAASKATIPRPLRETIGRSVDGRSIVAMALGDRRATGPMLVIGDIHGDEPAGIQVVRWLIEHRGRAEPPLWVLPDLNPDGVAADTRQNAHGVDLNRNFPYRWAQLYRRGDQQYQGPRPLSEPESRAAHRLILRLAPRVTIWFHQPQGLVDLSGGDPRTERRFAALVGLPVRRLVRYPGSAPTWQDHRFAGDTAFVVELPPGRLASGAVARYGRAVLGLARSGSTSR